MLKTDEYINSQRQLAKHMANANAEPHLRLKPWKFEQTRDKSILDIYL